MFDHNTRYYTRSPSVSEGTLITLVMALGIVLVVWWLVAP